ADIVQIRQSAAYYPRYTPHSCLKRKYIFQWREWFHQPAKADRKVERLPGIVFGFHTESGFPYPILSSFHPSISARFALEHSAHLHNRTKSLKSRATRNWCSDIILV